jgi:hypothetical protein
MSGVEWLSVVQSAAIALAAAAGTTAWHDARAGLLGMFGRAGGDESAVGRQLDRSASAVRDAPATDPAAQDRVREQLRLQWEARLGDLAEANPAVIDELRQWVRSVQQELPATVHYDLSRAQGVQVNQSGGNIQHNTFPGAG